MLAGISQFFTSTKSKIKDFLFPTRKLDGINFDVRTLCPEPYAKDVHKWIELYIQKFPEKDILLLWVNQDLELQLSFFHHKKIQHQSLSGSRVDLQTGTIFKNTQRIETVEALYDAADEDTDNYFSFSKTAFIPTADQLSTFKDAIYLSQNIVLPEMIEKLNALNEQVKQNFDSCSTCNICWDEYTEQKPAVLVPDSGHMYHQTCINDHFTTQGRHEVALTDPTTNIAIETFPATIPSPIGYKNIMEEGLSLYANYTKAMQIIDILQKQNVKLKKQLAQVDTTSAAVKIKR